MFNYYGSKSKIVDYYPPPKHKKIIEPFAGSARYSLKYWQNDVTIVDKFKNVIDVWKWLQQCSQKDILGLPKLVKGLDIRKLNISEVERTFLSFFHMPFAMIPAEISDPTKAEILGSKKTPVVWFKKSPGISPTFKMIPSLIAGRYGDGAKKTGVIPNNRWCIQVLPANTIL